MCNSGVPGGYKWKSLNEPLELPELQTVVTASGKKVIYNYKSKPYAESDAVGGVIGAMFKPGAFFERKATKRRRPVPKDIREREEEELKLASDRLKALTNKSTQRLKLQEETNYCGISQLKLQKQAQVEALSLQKLGAIKGVDKNFEGIGVSELRSCLEGGVARITVPTPPPAPPPLSLPRPPLYTPGKKVVRHVPKPPVTPLPTARLELLWEHPKRYLADLIRRRDQSRPAEFGKFTEADIQGRQVSEQTINSMRLLDSRPPSAEVRSRVQHKMAIQEAELMSRLRNRKSSLQNEPFLLRPSLSPLQVVYKIALEPPVTSTIVTPMSALRFSAVMTTNEFINISHLRLAAKRSTRFRSETALMNPSVENSVQGHLYEHLYYLIEAGTRRQSTCRWFPQNLRLTQSESDPLLLDAFRSLKIRRGTKTSNIHCLLRAAEMRCESGTCSFPYVSHLSHAMTAFKCRQFTHREYAIPTTATFSSLEQLLHITCTDKSRSLVGLSVLNVVCQEFNRRIPLYVLRNEREGVCRFLGIKTIRKLINRNQKLVGIAALERTLSSIRRYPGYNEEPIESVCQSTVMLHESISNNDKSFPGLAALYYSQKASPFCSWRMPLLRHFADQKFGLKLLVKSKYYSKSWNSISTTAEYCPGLQMLGQSCEIPWSIKEFFHWSGTYCRFNGLKVLSEACQRRMEGVVTLCEASMSQKPKIVSALKQLLDLRSPHHDGLLCLSETVKMSVPYLSTLGLLSTVTGNPFLTQLLSCNDSIHPGMSLLIQVSERRVGIQSLRNCISNPF